MGELFRRSGLGGHSLGLTVLLIAALFLAPLPSLAQVGFDGGEVNFYWADNTADNPTWFRQWNTSSDGLGLKTKTNDTSLTGGTSHVSVCDIPNRNQTVIVTHDSNNDAMVQLHNGTPGSIMNATITSFTFTDAFRHKPVSCAVEELNHSVVVMTSQAIGIADIITIYDGINFTMKSTTTRPSSAYQTRQHFQVS